MENATGLQKNIESIIKIVMSKMEMPKKSASLFFECFGEKNLLHNIPYVVRTAEIFYYIIFLM